MSYNKIVEDQIQKQRVLADSVGLVNRKVNAHIVKADKLSRDPGSKALDNPTGEAADGVGIIEPPYDLAILSSMRENNNAITPMVDAYKTNIAGFGFKLQYNIDVNSKDTDAGSVEQAKKDWVLLDNFYKYCNYDQSFTEIIQKMVDDKEYVGFGVLEVLNTVAGIPAGFEHIPAHTLKITLLDSTPQIVRLETVDAEGKKRTIPFQKKFRKFKQEIDNTVVWFKEFGDPRKMNKSTGEFMDEKGKLDPELEASGLIMFSNAVPYTIYGLPRWIGNILGMQGSRRSEELNYRYFSKGRHIPLAILVKNGSLTETSMDVLKGYVNNVEGVENAFGYLVLEAIGYDDEENLDSSKANKTDIDIKPLVDAMQTDGLFQQYDKDNRDKLRESMRLAPIYTGASKDYTRATADVAKAITEEQVFQPERKKIADRINRLVNQSLGVKYVDMVLNGPDITNKKELADTIEIYNKSGAITPNMVNQAVSNLLGQEFEPVSDAWANLPINLVLELIKQGKIIIKTGKNGFTLAVVDDNGVDNTDATEVDETIDEPIEEPEVEVETE